MRIKLIYFFICLASYTVAQTKTIKRNDLVWFGDINKIRLNDRWTVYFDLGLRRTEWLDKWSQILFRPGITYDLNRNISLTAGVAWFDHFSGKISRNEFRGWEQLQFNEIYGRLKLSHRLRVEQRLNQYVLNDKVTENYRYNTRYRYQFSVQLPLNRSTLEDKTFYLVLSDEVMINSGPEIIYNYFDQNRAAAGLGYKLNEKFNLSVSWMNDYIQRNQAGVFEGNNVIVINFYHNFRLNASHGK
jgi:long-subunit fatty acid transport protein